MFNSDITTIMFTSIVTITILLVLWLVVDISHTESSIFDSVKTGERVLTCELQSGTAVINPEKIRKYDSGIWYFYNGSASSCFLTSSF